jgi:hypothetical protein
MPDGTQVSAQVLNDSGGYHVILHHPQNSDLVIRLRRDERATTTAEGMANLEKLNKELRNAAVQGIRTPRVNKDPTKMAYIVEKVSGSVDALRLWNLKSQGDETAAKQLDAIRTLVQANIAAATQREREPFPDFRPSNVGVKEGSSDLIYIDFDQTGEVKEMPDLVDHVQEWAGKRYQRDPGGARKLDPDFFLFLTGGRLKGVKGTTEGLSTGIY